MVSHCTHKRLSTRSAGSGAATTYNDGAARLFSLTAVPLATKKSIDLPPPENSL
jgi:hypothetical protein